MGSVEEREHTLHKDIFGNDRSDICSNSASQCKSIAVLYVPVISERPIRHLHVFAF